MSKFVSSHRTYGAWTADGGIPPNRIPEKTMNVSMEAPRTPQHDLVAMTAALRGALMQRVEQGIQASGLATYYMYLVAKRLTFAGLLTAASISEQLRQNLHIVEDTLRQMLEQGQVSQDGETWQITESGRNALVSANDSGTEVLNQIREAIGASACDQLVAGMRGALAALHKAA